MSYSVCTILNKADVSIHVPDILYRAVFRAVELSRFSTKTTTDVIHEKAYNWLSTMQSYIRVFISKEIPAISKQNVKQIGEEYVDTILQCGMEFFDGNTPLSLICLLLDSCGLQDEKRVELCSVALCHSLTPMASVICENAITNIYGKMLFFYLTLHRPSLPQIIL